MIIAPVKKTEANKEEYRIILAALVVSRHHPPLALINLRQMVNDLDQVCWVHRRWLRQFEG
ncbi:hypothetical protein AN191_02775 [Loktanella sp. 5RATIMAR09]|nr:hypothetical protein AN191_02775 [Loktanella sp. 5RATIMAR09]